MSERQGVEIDYCPKCRGIWLDRGELDKILDRAETEAARSAPPAPAPLPPAATQQVPQQAPPQQPYPPQPPHPGYHRDLDDSKYGYQYQQPYKKRKSWWTEIFD
jgi:Zn-finger nucleic acid-binding protein